MKTKNLFPIAAILLALSLQMGLTPLIKIRGVAPDLALIVTLVIVVFNGFDKFWWLAVAAAYLADIFSGLPFGISMCSFIVAIYAADLLQRRVLTAAGFGVRAGVVGVGIILYNFLAILGGLWLGGIKLNLNGYIVIGTVCYDLICAILILYGFQKIFGQKQV